jgi:hypothetical protein
MFREYLQLGMGFAETTSTPLSFHDSLVARPEEILLADVIHQSPTHPLI